MSLLHEWDGDRPTSQWRYRVVAVEQSGSITLPPAARRVLGTESFALAATRGGVLVLHDHGAGASLAIDPGRQHLLQRASIPD